jgi:hypothetical protein
MVEDANKWLRIMRKFVDAIEPAEPLWTQGTYEVILGTFFHRKDLTGCRDLIKPYLAKLPTPEEGCEPGQLRDFLTVANCAAIAGEVELSPAEIAVIKKRIADICARALMAEERPSHRCGYFDVQLLLALFEPNIESMARHGNIAAVLREIVDLAPTAHFYNAHALAEALCRVAPALEGSPEIRRLLADLDGIVAERFGGGAAASLCLERAQGLHAAGQVFAAIRQLHRAKTGWFNGESMAECVRAFVALADLYCDAGLFVAALRHGQAGLLIAGTQTTNIVLLPEISALLQTVSHCRLLLGHSYEYLQIAEVALAIDQTSLEEMLPMYMSTVAAIELVEPRLGRAIRMRWSQHPQRGNLLADAHAEMALTSGRDLLESGEWDLFRDCGSERRIEWVAFGSHWCVSCRNSPHDVEAAEDVAGMLQVLHADMFDRDPWLHIGVIQIVVASEPGNARFRAVGRGEHVEVFVGEGWVPQNQEEQFDLLILVLGNMFIKRDLSQDMEDALQDGILHKVFSAAPHSVLRRESIVGRRPRAVRSKRLRDAAKVGELPEGQLRLLSTRVSGHAGQEWDDAIAFRYQSWVTKLGPSLRALRRHKIVQGKVNEWRSRGVPEWHIVGALGSLVANYAFANERKTTISPDDFDEFGCFFQSLPLSDRVYEIPADMLTEEHFEKSMESYLAAFLISEGVVIDGGTWDRARFEAFAINRLGFGEHGPKAPDWFGEQ